jgi:nucleoside-diphosphate-sugar epimerase
MGGLRPRRILILGGTGFVGTELRKQAEAQGGWECITLSRRGGVGPSHVAGDATSPGVIEAVVAERGPFSAYVHCLGALLDGKSEL